VFASCAPAIAEAQYTVQWAAPAAVTSTTAYLPMGTPLQLTTRTEMGASIYLSPNWRSDDSLSAVSGSGRCGRLGFSDYRTT
jgi:predicted secreted protein